jgi:hypothetical protein
VVDLADEEVAPPNGAAEPNRDEEIIEGPDPGTTPGKPERPWYEQLRDDTPAAAAEAAPQLPAGRLGVLVAGTIAALHHLVARKTGYSGFELDDDLKEQWARLFDYLLKDTKIKNAPLYFMAISISISYVGILVGYGDWRKATHAPPFFRPTRPPEGALAPPPPAADKPAKLTPEEIFELTKPRMRSGG